MGTRAARQGKDGFFARVYVLVARIPRGRVATYGQIARILGAPRSARIVGWAMHGSPEGAGIPCHRVVQQGGTCSPNFRVGEPGAQRHLLEKEGVRFLPDGRVDLEAHRWSPWEGTKRQRPERRRGRAEAG
ncbi:MAG TPA: methylated-DNA--[protein]-cysteine S-methyltransferase [Candidatus Methylomirabilis sp.]|nr:methylated-DNA--[protein]-cysteine S-methyltransferase [Candidatus Methylomirabilis sp.]